MAFDGEPKGYLPPSPSMRVKAFAVSAFMLFGA
jgi:hypothetical protein